MSLSTILVPPVLVSITCSSYKVILVSFQFVRHYSLFFQFSGFLKVYCILFDKSSEKRPGILWNMYHSRSAVVTPSPSLCWLMLNRTTSPTSFSSTVSSMIVVFVEIFFLFTFPSNFVNETYPVVFRHHGLWSHHYHVV